MGKFQKDGRAHIKRDICDRSHNVLQSISIFNVPRRQVRTYPEGPGSKWREMRHLKNGLTKLPVLAFSQLNHPLNFTWESALAGAQHAVKKVASANEKIALTADLLVFLMMAAYLLTSILWESIQRTGDSQTSAPCTICAKFIPIIIIGVTNFIPD